MNRFTGKYYRTCQNDIKSSQGWFGKICLLGLISFIPVFGQMTLYGYAFEWGHQIAWGVHEPLPKKIYGRPGSKMLRWGWFAFVISFIFALVPGLIQGLGSFMSAAGSTTVVATGRGLMTVGGNPVLAVFGSIIGFIGVVALLFTWIFSLVAIIRMTMYDRFGAGFQLGKIWKMGTHDFGGLMRIFGMAMIIELICGLIVGFVVVIFIVGIVGATIAPLAASYNMGTATASAAALNALVPALLACIPVFLIVFYFASVVQSWVQLLVGRAVGYWCQQFDVKDWGTMEDPLPFERSTASAPVQAPFGAPVASQPPAPQQSAPTVVDPMGGQTPPQEPTVIIEEQTIIEKKPDNEA